MPSDTHMHGTEVLALSPLQLATRSKVAESTASNPSHTGKVELASGSSTKSRHLAQDALRYLSAQCTMLVTTPDLHSPRSPPCPCSDFAILLRRPLYM